MSVTVEVLAADGDEAYGGFVSRHPAAMIYYSLRFRDMLVALLGCRPVYGIARRGGDVAGVFPLMLAVGSYGDLLNSLPYFGSNGGPLCADDDDEARSALHHWYREQAGGAASATVVENPLLNREDLPASLHSDRVSVVTSLLGPDESRATLLERIDSSARRNVLKAERSGVVVSVAGDDPAAIESLASLHRLNMQVNRGPVKTTEFFDLLPTVFRPSTDYQLYLAKVDGETVGALLVMFYGTVADYYIPATLPEARSVQPMSALLCFAMVDAAERGCSRWNWGGSGVGNETLIRFKVKWAGRRSTYRYLTQLNDERLLDVPPEELMDIYPGFYVRPFAPVPDDTNSAAG